MPNVLWAYRTIARTPTGETPFRLIYGTEAVIPVEIGVASTKRTAFSKEGNDDKLRLSLDCLDEVRDKASSRMVEYQRKMAEYYNKRVKLRQLDIGDLVLRKSYHGNKRPNPRKARAYLGRTIPSRPLLPMRQLSPGNFRRTEAPSPMEHRALEEIPPINVLDECVHS